MRLGKYSRWAVNLTEAQLEAIIWMVGEYGYRAFHVLPLLAGLWDKEPDVVNPWSFRPGSRRVGSLNDTGR